MEIAATAGVDAAFIDLEHTSIGLSMLEQLVVAADCYQLPVLVRPPTSDPALVTRILDLGACGIVFPRVEDAMQAAAAKSALAFPPRGVRGWGGPHTRSAGWRGESSLSGRPDGEGYNESAVSDLTESLVSVFLIESMHGVENIEAILDVGTPDWVEFGLGDFAVEAGFDAVACAAAYETVYEACRSRGVGVNVVPGGDAVPFVGCFTIIGLDALMLRDQIRETLRVVRGVRRS